jgi:hypothetical protein
MKSDWCYACIGATAVDSVVKWRCIGLWRSRYMHFDHDLAHFRHGNAFLHTPALRLMYFRPFWPTVNEL